MTSTLTPKELFTNYLKREGWKNLTIKSRSFLFTFLIFIMLIIFEILKIIWKIDFMYPLFLFLKEFFITGFIGAISILMIILAGFAIIGSIMEKKFLYTAKELGVLDIFYFVFFWDVLWSGIASFCWLLFGFLLNINFYFLKLLVGIAAFLITIYAISFSISMVLSITKFIDFKTNYAQIIIKIEEDLKSSKK
jgi:hypothetical protein